MSLNALPTNIDVAQLVQNLREKVDRRSDKFIASEAQAGTHIPESRISPELTNRLRSIDDEIEALNSQIQSGEPSPLSPKLHNQIGSLIKRRLYRFLWWQNNQIKALAESMLRRGREEMKLVDAFSQSVGESNRRIHELESRLRHLESAQLRLQASEIERNVRNSAAQEESVTASARQLQDALGAAEARITGKVLSEAATAMQRIAELAQRLDAETGEKEKLALRLSELGLLTHQTRVTLSIQDRRLARFIEEARRTVPRPVTDNQLQDLGNSHVDHKYDSLYMAFEDVFRGSRAEIKARQSVYLPFLTERGIGSAGMPILDLGCGRGEWLELLGEHNFHAVGLDCNEAMIEQCNSIGLKVIQGDALSYLGKLADASLGAVTSFHMIEHLPFEVTLALVDEILRVLKPGGVIILETPNPQNILVGAHTFYLDPTHLKPLPSPMLRFFVEARGFCDVHVWELHPYPEAIHLPDEGKGIASRLNHYLYGPQDYAVIGRKA